MPLPPTPTSLADLPGPWLLKLAGSDSFEGQNATLWSMSRTCSLFRDLVLRQRRAEARFNVPIAAEDFPRQLQRLCTLARGSRDIRLEVRGPRGNAPWTAAEPHIAHLLLCAMAQLGGQPLTAVKEIRFFHLEQTSLVPMWLPLTCPNVTNLECSGGAITDHLPLPAPPPPRSTTTASPAPAPVACQHLHRLDLSGTERLGAQHLRQQLAALPSLSTLNLWDSLRMAAELHSTSVTHLAFLYDDEDSRVLERLPAQFPNLVEMSAPSLCALDDDGLEALLSVRSLRRVDLWGLRLQRSHAHRPCAWEDLLLWRMDVDSVARLPLEGIRRLCIDGNEVCPSRDAQAVARVAAIVKRSGVLGAKDGVTFSGEDPAALLTTLRPLLAPLPAEQQRRVTIKGMGQEATPEVVRQMEEHVVAVCAGAVRPITVAVCFTCVEEQQRILSQLAERGNTHVTLEWLG